MSGSAVSPIGDSAAAPVEQAAARTARDPVWAKLLVVFGALLFVASTGVIVAEKYLVASVSAKIPQTNLLGGTSGPAPVVPTHASINGAVNILLAGIDERTDQNPADPSRADSIIVLHIPVTHDAAYLVSIPRDSLVPIPADPTVGYRGGHDKINAAYAFGSSHGQGRVGGFQLLAKTINQLTGITFNAGMIVNFGGFQQLVAALGGVDMCVDEKTISIHVGYDSKGRYALPYDMSSGTPRAIRGVTPQVYQPGCQHLAAWQALDYVRQRELLPDGDYGRERHQQQFLKAVFTEALSSGVLTNPGKLSAVLNAAGQAFTVDTGGIGIDDWIYAMRDIRPTDLVTLKTNGGQFNTQTTNGVAYELLNPTSMELLHAVSTDTVDTFVSQHPDWVATT
jgi:LCP family protein required for cell wall assembly